MESEKAPEVMALLQSKSANIGHLGPFLCPTLQAEFPRYMVLLPTLRSHGVETAGCCPCKNVKILLCGVPLGLLALLGAILGLPQDTLVPPNAPKMTFPNELVFHLFSL